MNSLMDVLGSMFDGKPGMASMGDQPGLIQIINNALTDQPGKIKPGPKPTVKGMKPKKKSKLDKSQVEPVDFMAPTNPQVPGGSQPETGLIPTLQPVDPVAPIPQVSSPHPAPVAGPITPPQTPISGPVTPPQTPIGGGEQSGALDLSALIQQLLGGNGGNDLIPNLQWFFNGGSGGGGGPTTPTGPTTPPQVPQQPGLPPNIQLPNESGGPESVPMDMTRYGRDGGEQMMYRYGRGGPDYRGMGGTGGINDDGEDDGTPLWLRQLLGRQRT